jgi:hypothetical protein
MFGVDLLEDLVVVLLGDGDVSDYSKTAALNLDGILVNGRRQANDCDLVVARLMCVS